MTGEPVQDVSEIAATVFGVLFLGAGAAKLEGIHGWTELVRRFPFRAPVRRAVWLGVPAVEIGVGVLAVVRPAAGLVAASVLLLVFCAALVRHLPSLRGAECHCFGKASVSRIDTRLIWRNLALAVLAATAAAGAVSSGAQPIPPLQIATIALLAVVAFLLAEYRALPKVEGIGDLRTPAEEGLPDG